ncbi:uncharacterized protein B0J16DRAFT_383425 [Fusarium flagelliforme]|uniref:Uncharacterized protein n=1 Tax=Fusarium flagelliforme TaxID=2675880 RepID=A0A395MQV5_9HYPO|nr:uncharacterized protein B0J16DRAFT_383425 [Fusarium flagelliforme]KAH7189561.1 hypothetical protein B0J16DRAFT_383425 [Fusarium flagelliforme]RFN50127.1 hypothetical protein FIE12Z_5655 [Fusarium flagelliforme]
MVTSSPSPADALDGVMNINDTRLTDMVLSMAEKVKDIEADHHAAVAALAEIQAKCDRFLALADPLCQTVRLPHANRSSGCKAGIDLGYEPWSSLCADPPNTSSSLDCWSPIQEAIAIIKDLTQPRSTAHQCPACLADIAVTSFPPVTPRKDDVSDIDQHNSQNDSFPETYLPYHCVSTLVVLPRNSLILPLIAQYRAAGTYAQPVSKESVAAYVTTTLYIPRQSRT